MPEWIEEVNPKTEVLANLVTLVVAVGTIIWGASSISSSVDQLEDFRDDARQVHAELEAEQDVQEIDIIYLEVVQMDLVNELQRLRGADDVRNSGRSGTRSTTFTGWPRVVALPREGTPEPESRRPPEGSRAALPGGKQEGDAQY